MKKEIKKTLIVICVAKKVIMLLCALYALNAGAQTEELLPYGNFDRWVVRHIKESSIIGGDTKTLYEVGPNQTINGTTPYANKGGSPWGTSNVLAHVSGIYKTNCSVYRDRRGAGFCAKLETHVEKVKVLGMINISVIAAGSVFLGSMREPITSTKDGPAHMCFGIPFTKRPHALRFDYKVKAPASSTRLKMTGFSGKSTVAGQDHCIAVLLLQRRKENAKGEIYAERVGTVVVRYGRTTADWVANATYEIHYGDMRGQKGYNAAMMGLRNGTDYAINSKGQSVPIREIKWANADAQPTHLCLQFSSSDGGAYIGTPGNTLWVDNVRLVY